MIKDERIEKDYICYWCGKEFKRMININNTNFDSFGRTIKAITSQVKCRNCGSFIKT